jgi:hypothetical protein
MIEFLSNPLVWKVIIAYWIFSSAVGAMPTPLQTSSLWYIFFFRFLHGLAGNLNRAAVSLKVPGADATTP